MKDVGIAGLQEDHKKAIGEFLEKLQEAFGKRIRFVKVFGSVARGESTPFSDIDLFVLVDSITLEEDAMITQITVDINLRYDVVLSPVVYTLKEYEDPRRKAVPFFQAVMKEGILL